MKQLEVEYSKAKDVSIEVVFTDDRVTSKRIKYSFRDVNELFGDSKIDFSNIGEIENKSEQEEKITYDEFKEIMGLKKEGNLVEINYYEVLENTEKYVYADKEENYLEVEIRGQNISEINGHINGKKIKLEWKFV